MLYNFPVCVSHAKTSAEDGSSTALKHLEYVSCRHSQSYVHLFFYHFCRTCGNFLDSCKCLSFTFSDFDRQWGAARWVWPLIRTHYRWLVWFKRRPGSGAQQHSAGSCDISALLCQITPSHLTRPTLPMEGPNEPRQQCWLVTWGFKGHARNVCVCVSVLIYDVWGLSSPSQSCVAVYEIKKKHTSRIKYRGDDSLRKTPMTLSVCRYWRRFHATRRMQMLKNWDGF